MRFKKVMNLRLSVIRKLWKQGYRRDELARRDLSEAELNYCDLFNARLAKANLSDCNLAKADLRNCDLSEARLDRADLFGANLYGANLRNCDLSEACLDRANLNYCDLSGARLEEANLIRADLKNSDLTGANLTGADLDQSNLFGADLTGANLTGADLTCADLRYCTGLPYVLLSSSTGRPLTAHKISNQWLFTSDYDCNQTLLGIVRQSQYYHDPDSPEGAAWRVTLRNCVNQIKAVQE